jgi:hypothetical protein
MTALTLETQSTALGFIDLQNGILGMPTAPYAALDVATRSAQLAKNILPRRGRARSVAEVVDALA